MSTLQTPTTQFAGFSARSASSSASSPSLSTTTKRQQQQKIDWKQSVNEIIENADLDDQGENLDAIQFLDSNFTPELVNSIPELDLKNHSLLRIPPVVKRFASLTSLDLSENQIQFVDSPLLTRYCPSLKKIDLSKNFIEDIREVQMLGLLKHLEELNISDNPLPLIENRLHLIQALLFVKIAAKTADSRKRVSSQPYSAAAASTSTSTPTASSKFASRTVDINQMHQRSQSSSLLPIQRPDSVLMITTQRSNGAISYAISPSPSPSASVRSGSRLQIARPNSAGSSRNGSKKEAPRNLKSTLLETLRSHSANNLTVKHVLKTKVDIEALKKQRVVSETSSLASSRPGSATFLTRPSRSSPSGSIQARRSPSPSPSHRQTPLNSTPNTSSSKQQEKKEEKIFQQDEDENLYSVDIGKREEEKMSKFLESYSPCNMSPFLKRISSPGASTPTRRPKTPTSSRSKTEDKQKQRGFQGQQQFSAEAILERMKTCPIPHEQTNFPSLWNLNGDRITIEEFESAESEEIFDMCAGFKDEQIADGSPSDDEDDEPLDNEIFSLTNVAFQQQQQQQQQQENVDFSDIDDSSSVGEGNDTTEDEVEGDEEGEVEDEDLGIENDLDEEEGDFDKLSASGGRRKIKRKMSSLSNVSKGEEEEEDLETKLEALGREKPDIKITTLLQAEKMLQGHGADAWVADVANQELVSFEDYKKIPKSKKWDQFISARTADQSESSESPPSGRSSSAATSRSATASSIGIRPAEVDDQSEKRPGQEINFGHILRRDFIQQKKKTKKLLSRAMIITPPSAAEDYSKKAKQNQIQEMRQRQKLSYQQQQLDAPSSGAVVDFRPLKHQFLEMTMDDIELRIKRMELKEKIEFATCNLELKENAKFGSGNQNSPSSASSWIRQKDADRTSSSAASLLTMSSKKKTTGATTLGSNNGAKRSPSPSPQLKRSASSSAFDSEINISDLSFTPKTTKTKLSSETKSHSAFSKNNKKSQSGGNDIEEDEVISLGGQTFQYKPYLFS